MRHLRQYQKDMKAAVYDTWARGAIVTVMQSATGSGKGEVIADIAGELPGAGSLMVHRRELVSQLSMSFARRGIAHNIMTPPATRNMIVRRHMKLLGRTTYNANGNWTIGTVDTINARFKSSAEVRKWAQTVKNVFTDEGHHVLRLNKWGKAFALFENMERGLLPTATPGRPDGKGLGSWSDGIADALVEGPPPRWLIDNAYLCGYQIYAVRPSDLDVEDIEISEATGDFNPVKLAEAVKKSKTIIGDIVETYCKYAWGEKGITFAVDIEHAHRIADAFNRRGVPAIAISSKNTDDERESALAQFEAGTIWQLVNVDLFGEGFDLPNVQCISMGRPTASFIVYAQEFGRVLRLAVTELQAEMWDTFDVAIRKAIIAASSKPYAKVFDHSANVYRHEGPPDKPRVWSLDPRTRRKWRPGDDIPMTGCLGCFKSFERFYTACPYCGKKVPAPTTRGGADEVDGNVYLMSPELLAKFHRDIEHIKGPPSLPIGRPELNGVVRHNHAERQKQQALLQRTVDLWAGSYPEVSNETNYKRFYFLFGMDVVQACTLGAGDAEKLRNKVVSQMAQRGIVINF